MQLTGTRGESDYKVKQDDTVTRATNGYAAKAGVTAAEGAEQLTKLSCYVPAPESSVKLPNHTLTTATSTAVSPPQHLGPPSVVTMSRARTACVLDVADDCPSVVPEFAERRPVVAGGRGLRLTADLTRDCGWYLGEDTKHAWALFDIRNVGGCPGRLASPSLALPR